MSEYGWAGQILRVNLTNGDITTSSTEPYKKYVGGMGIGYKVIWDEVPLDTDPYSEQAKAVIAVGPITGSGVPCSGRTNISFLTAYSRGYSICDAHIGGHWAQYMKYAGYDAIIIEGRSNSPVYLKINDANVSLEPADHLWGEGTFYTNQQVMAECGPEFTSFAIGPAGENLVNYSIIHGSQGHAGGGGIGAIFGSKNLKAIACRGTGSVKIADPERLKELKHYMLSELIGGNNNHNVPQQPQSWAEFTHAGPASGRWHGAPGMEWGANPSGPVDLGEQPYWDKNRIAYRSLKNQWHPGWGDLAQKYLVKEGGCSHCPVRCYGQYEIPPLQEYGVGKHTNTCTAGLRFGGPAWLPAPAGRTLVEGTEPAENDIMSGALAAKTADDLGLWCNYQQIWQEFNWCLTNGIFEPISRGGVIPDSEHAEIRWDLYENYDPEWIPYILDIIAHKKGEISHLGDGTYVFAKRWNLPESFWNGMPIEGGGREINTRVTYNGYPIHHGTEAFQASFLHNNLYNRDNMIHAIANFHNCGLPESVAREVLEAWFGEGCWDPPAAVGRTPINENKITLARWAFLHKQWHDMATLCDWIWPMTMSPSRDRGYSGDLDLEGKFMTAVTGEDWDNDKIHESAERVSAMLRVMTAISFNIHYGSTNLREDHDKINDHWFDRQPNLQPFDPGATKLCREDWAKSQDMFYERMGWDVRTGIPTRDTLLRLGLDDMVDALMERGLLTVNFIV